MQFEIEHRFSKAVIFTAEIDCNESADRSIKLGLAVSISVNKGADLRGADLTDAYLINCGFRSDGYEFYALTRSGELWIKAGCRFFSISDARKHWVKRAGTQLGEETTAILDHAERTAKIRGLLGASLKAADAAQ